MTTKSWRARPAAFFLGDPGPLARHGAVAVIGLGRFGGSLASELDAHGVDVIGIDIDEAVVAQYSETLAFVSRADSTDEAVLRQLGIEEVSRVVIAIGSDLEASILTASKILKIGNGHIWAKAISQTHAEILDQLGIENVISPETDMGRRLAHLIRGHMSDFLPISEDFVLARTTPPTRISDLPLSSFDLRGTYGVTVVAFRRNGDGHWDIADQEVTLYTDDEMLIAGTPRNVEDFSAIDKDD
ncbi:MULTISPECIES: TrkA family potassium uptake protein [Brevibacterium]|uniref:Trk system potassium uptake protein TrkA n=1 Tax=Brevibacterium antiquum CNRZ 918 TaxID=1255637 RepID=A0A2H1K1X3_9MICO|nr:MULTISPECIES: TrkA family potassium uptake protein [Brevibacterium]SMX93679.1 trk system potassium uptake protein TrkA [Brevibacterium antiquum CNRZ 918]HCG55616.1 TrkA family potassium uptake protein [Brevibacterium sp.]